MPLPGWKRLGGKAERYRNPQGQNVSRRQYDNARARRAGWSSYSQFTYQSKTSQQFKQGRTDAILGKGLSRRSTGIESEFSKKYRAAMKARRTNAPDLYDPDGPLADYLVYIGQREPEWDWQVGETDQMMRQAA